MPRSNKLLKSPTPIDSSMEDLTTDPINPRDIEDSQNYKFRNITIKKFCIPCGRVTGHHITNTSSGVNPARVCTECHFITITLNSKTSSHPDPSGVVLEWIKKNPLSKVEAGRYK